MTRERGVDVNKDAGRRSAPRLRALKPGRIYPSGRAIGHDCTVRSLNRTGAGVELVRPVELEGAVEFYFVTENVRVPAEIAWQAGNRIGIRFARPLDWLFSRG
jgi:hypothetical protein